MKRFGKLFYEMTHIRWCRNHEYYDRPSWRGTLPSEECTMIDFVDGFPNIEKVERAIMGEWVMDELIFPNRITVELTNDCNVSCTFCNRQKIQMEIGYMDENLFHKIIDEATEYLPVKLVPFFRGEPLMHPKIIEFIQYAKEKGIGPIQLASNALLLNEEMQNALLDTGIDFISFSLDTIDAEIYNCTRLTGDLEVSARNVESFGRKCKERKRHGLNAPVLQVSTIDIKEYKATQKEFVEKWKKYVDVVRVYEQHDEEGKLVNLSTCEKVKKIDKRMPCRKIFTDMIIYWNGKVSLCNYDWDEKRDIGDINNMTLKQAWNSPEYEKIRAEHLQNCITEDICEKCQHWMIDYVEGGFLGKSYRGE